MKNNSGWVLSRHFGLLSTCLGWRTSIIGAVRSFGNGDIKHYAIILTVAKYLVSTRNASLYSMLTAPFVSQMRLVTYLHIPTQFLRSLRVLPPHGYRPSVSTCGSTGCKPFSTSSASSTIIAAKVCDRLWRGRRWSCGGFCQQGRRWI